MLIFGCQHVFGRGGAESPHSLSSITPEELFEVGLLHARQGDLLRAEVFAGAITAAVIQKKKWIDTGIFPLIWIISMPFSSLPHR